MDLKSTYNKIAGDWVKDHDHDTWWQEGTNAFLSLLPNGASVLDVGCGGGIKTRYMAERGFAVTGIDFSEGMIEVAKREAPELDFAVVNVYNIDIYPKTFDAMFAQAVLLHIPKRDVLGVLKKLKSRLNPGGLLYIAVKSVKDDKVEEAVIKEDDYGYPYERFFSFFSADELEDYFKKLGMELVSESRTDSGRAGWIQVVGKKI